jgi:hypothetical protein
MSSATDSSARAGTSRRLTTGQAAELRETAASQLGRLVRVLVDRSDSSVGERLELAVEPAEEMQLR